MQEILDIFVLDVRTMIAILFLGNFLAFVTVYAYWFSNRRLAAKKLVFCVMFARLFLSLAFLLTSFRGVLHDILSVNLGNSFLLLGFFLEAVSMLLIIREGRKGIYKLLLGITGISILAFNLMEYMITSASLRVTAASIGVFAVMAIPSFRMLLARKATFFKRFAGFLYCFFTALLLPRAMHTAMNRENDIFSGFLVQSLTFLSLVMILVFSLSVFLLLMKEESDAVMESLARTDYLTGLFNRHSFNEEAVRHVERHKREKASFCILYMDIDHFKNVNDTHGHGFGDEVIKRTADIMRKNVRISDVCARYGGEEFIMLLPDSEQETGYSVAKRISREIEEAKFKEKPDFRYTVSIGLIEAGPVGDDSIMDIIDKADKALYHAKESGRNRIVVYKE